MKLHYRTIWISDTHLGTKACKAEYLRDFIDNTESETLYLVGDIIDLWKFKNGVYWPTLHGDIVQRIINKAKNGTRVIYIPGNHDGLLRKHAGTHFNGIDIQLNAIYTTAQGKKFLVLHGDEFDHLVCNNRSLFYLGGGAYEVLLIVNRWLNCVRNKLGFKYWSLAHYLKYKVKNITSFMHNYRHILSLEAQKRKVDGIICGHIHQADLTQMEFGKAYANCGDWVESCTALAEDFQGNMTLIHWLEDSYRLLDTQPQPLPTYAATELPICATNE
jgi:UDP-2,3-diacylglucosamine pyrophosphatase LpxH